MPRRIISILTLIMALTLTVGLSWFAIRNYRSAAPIADDSLRGLALTIAAAMEGVAGRDPSLEALSSFKAREIAYAMLVSTSGKILFHSNPDLIGANAGDQRYLRVLKTGMLEEERVKLGTGESVYEFQAPFHLAGETCVLRLALHTWRSEAVMRRARFGIALIFSLLALGWGLGITVYWLLRRQAAQEKQLARQHELARLGEVGAVLAHEVRNPLAGIKGYGQLLEEQLPEGRQREYAHLIIRESLRLERLAEDILFITRPGDGVSRPVELLAVARQLTALLAPQLASAGVGLTIDVAGDMRVYCPEGELHRVLLNLFTNAIQALPGGGEIRLEAHHGSNGMIVISVGDSGSGIAPEMRAELFEPFRTSKARGAGLGLAVCKKIITGCGGAIIVEDAVGGGALFVVNLPAVRIEGSV
jgi:two-component system sensor histidine kinase HydH